MSRAGPSQPGQGQAGQASQGMAMPATGQGQPAWAGPAILAQAQVYLLVEVVIDQGGGGD